MHGLLPIFFLLVVLKIPVLGSLWLVWWASKEPKPEEDAAPGSDEGHGRRPPFAPRPRGPHPTPMAPSLRRRGQEAGVAPELRRHLVREADNPTGRQAHPPPSQTT
jgi:hypothetical protein